MMDYSIDTQSSGSGNGQPRQKTLLPTNLSNQQFMLEIIHCNCHPDTVVDRIVMVGSLGSVVKSISQGLGLPPTSCDFELWDYSPKA